MTYYQLKKLPYWEIVRYFGRAEIDTPAVFHPRFKMYAALYAANYGKRPRRSDCCRLKVFCQSRGVNVRLD